MCYLKMKETDSNNGVDNFIRTKQMNNDMSWFPIRRAKTLSLKFQMLDKVNTKVKP